MKNILTLLFSFLVIHNYAQSDSVKGLVLGVKAVKIEMIIYQGDTIPYVTLEPIQCYGDKVFLTVKEKVAWDRLKSNVKKVYPYAILAAAKLKEYDKVLSQMPEKDRAQYTKVAEKELKKQFGKELENLSINQGRILMKLIDRETGKTTYKVVKDMRGSFSAFMWQSVALMVGSSMKAEYDPAGDDKNIEEAIRLIEAGDY